MVPLHARLFRFTTEEDIDATDFAKKTGMNVKSVASMIKQAASNAALYERMLAAGYTDAEFPDWWYSPGRAGGEGAGAGGEGAKAGKSVDVPGEGGELRIDVDKVERAEGYDVIPPRQPVSREGRPALQAQRSDPIRSDPIQAEHVSPPFSDAELYPC